MLVIYRLTDLPKLFFNRLTVSLRSNCARNEESVAFPLLPSTIPIFHIFTRFFAVYSGVIGSMAPEQSFMGSHISIL